MVCVDCNPDIVHMHTWDMVTGDLDSKNGFRNCEIAELLGKDQRNISSLYLRAEVKLKTKVRAIEFPIDLVLLDWMLPKGQGIDS